MIYINIHIEIFFVRAKNKKASDDQRLSLITKASWYDVFGADLQNFELKPEKVELIPNTSNGSSIFLIITGHTYIIHIVAYTTVPGAS